jgi:hypothetical protein
MYLAVTSGFPDRALFHSQGANITSTPSVCEHRGVSHIQTSLEAWLLAGLHTVVAFYKALLQPQVHTCLPSRQTLQPAVYALNAITDAKQLCQNQ